MNSYNENLNSSVVATLQAQELEQDNMQAQLNAAMFTLYYAEGAKITALEKLDETEQLYRFQKQVKEKTIDNNNTAMNVLASANQSQQYVTLSAGNVATAAANVQVAANAVVRLASDMGSILSILNAAQFGSPIYKQAVEANKLLNDTAYNAGVASQLAMEGSLLTAGVSAGTVADIAKTTAASVAQLLSAAAIQFDNTGALVSAGNAALADASVLEKKAQGNLEDINVAFYATQASYMLSMQEMNLNLQVKADKNQPSSKYNVSFSPYLNPFYQSEVAAGDPSDYNKSPVTDYYIILVKETKKTTFSSTSAAQVTDGDAAQYLHVLNDATNSSAPVSKDIFMADLLDSDGDAMEIGRNYVIFVWAKFNDNYRKAIGSDAFLTAPSAPFALTNQLKAASHLEVLEDHGAQKLVFRVEKEHAFKVEHRCMFLPDSSDLIKGLITESQLRDLNNEVEQLERIAERFDPVLMQDEATIISLNTVIDAINKKIEGLPEKDRAKDAQSEAGKALAAQLKEQKERLGAAKAHYKSTSLEKQEAVSKMDFRTLSAPGFFFNKLLAAQIPEGSYTTHHESYHKKDNDSKSTFRQLELNDSLTDNFGNPLRAGEKYLPVVLSCALVGDDNSDQFTSALSDYQHANAFFYHNNK